MGVFLFLVAMAAPADAPVTEEIQWSVHYSPKGGCTDAAVALITSAKEEVLVQAYSFTSQPICDALVSAHKRGVAVKAIFDKSDMTANGSLITDLKKSGVPVWIDAQHAIAHNKILIVDRKIVGTGSFNFTDAAEKANAENFLIITSAKLAAKYAANWESHEGHSRRLAP